MQVYIHIFFVVIHVYENICTISVPAPLCLAGPADTRMHDRPARPTAFRWNQKYPRVCGEKKRCIMSSVIHRGSPPRMRGKAACRTCLYVASRITPAYAGKSFFWRNGQPGNEDHPRVCGEKTGQRGVCRSTLGSPPRMRGKVLNLLVICVLMGITPAYAGKSYCIPNDTNLTRDHPRVCGEKPRRRRQDHP